MDTRVLLRLLNELVENKLDARVTKHFIAFCSSFMKLDNTGVRMLNFYSLF